MNVDGEFKLDQSLRRLVIDGRRQLVAAIAVASSLAITALSAAADWPQFRGPTGQGNTESIALPTEWSETQNVAWKVPTPGFGLSSPIVQGQQIWMTAAEENGKSLRAVCFDASDGSLLRSVELFRPAEPPTIHQKNSFASPTPVIEGDRVYANFGPIGTACFRTDGTILWKNSKLKYRSQYGAASSPIGYRNLLIFNCDGNDEQFVVALDKESGQIAWKVSHRHVDGGFPPQARDPEPRPNIPRMAHSTPLVIHAGGADQLISTAANHVAAYDPKTGREIWWYGYDGFSVAARPVANGSLVFPIGIEDHASTYVLYGIDPNRDGRAMDDQVAWRLDRSIPAVPSPIVVGSELFVVSDDGIVTCVDTATGSVCWRKRLGGTFSASPIASPTCVYFTNEDGQTTVLAASEELNVVAKNRLDGRFLASPAVVDDSLILRSDTHLYRITSQTASTATTPNQEPL